MTLAERTSNVKQISIHELARYASEEALKEPCVITSGGHPVAHLIPVVDAGPAILPEARLVRGGKRFVRGCEAHE